MRRSAGIVLLIVAAIALGRFSPRARNVDVVGLFASGLSAGVGLTMLMRRGK